MGEPTEVLPTAVGQTSNEFTIDSSHSYYLHPSDAPGMTLVNSPFDGKGFGGWKRGMFVALSANNKTGFIDGSLSKPATTDPSLKSWTRCNDISAQLLWKDLESIFGQTNGTKLFQLQKELSTLVQGNLSVTGYFTKLKCIWDELDAMNIISFCSCECVCGGKDKSKKAQDDERLLQFLMGLNSS
ncbi:uncharacterized protein LOC132637909 [Lycium barbarum]|uniref:uncharacterized protein LOC132637909 n=1 Tax=Lycium barbarum TaxID=112863 RepID=UPI00293EA062|nr:uncharacterized protein LOC132637909 [Lycium barbarum]